MGRGVVAGEAGMQAKVDVLFHPFTEIKKLAQSFKSRLLVSLGLGMLFKSCTQWVYHAWKMP